MDDTASKKKPKSARKRGAPESGEGNVAILVAGMHRSGTSAVTGALAALGCSPPKTLMPATSANAAGYWESLVVTELNDALLTSAGSAWDDWRPFDPGWYHTAAAEEFCRRAQAALRSEFGTSRLFVLKDPRLCRLMSFWLTAVEAFGASPRIVIPVRNPFDVAASLETRDKIDPGVGQLLWLRHVLDAVAGSNGFTRSIVRYERLLTGWQDSVQRIQQALGVKWPRPAADITPDLDAFLSSELQHHATKDVAVLASPELSDWLRTTFEILNRWSDDDVRDCDADELRRTKAAFDAAVPAFAPAVSAGRAAGRRVLELDAVVTAVRGRVSELEVVGASLQSELATAAARAAHLEHTVGVRDAELATMHGALAERASLVSALEAAVGDAQATLVQRDAALAERDADIAGRDAALAERDSALATSTAEISARDRALSARDVELAARDAALAAQQADIGLLRQQLVGLCDVLSSHQATITDLYASIAALRTSTSWRVTAPLRAISHLVRFGGKSEDASMPSDSTHAAARFIHGTVGYPLLFAVRSLRRGARAPLRDWLNTRRVAQSGLFDREWYLARYPDVAALGIDPVRHYVAFGAREGRDPSPTFSTAGYLNRNPDVAAAGWNPLVHFVRHGRAEHRSGSGPYNPYQVGPGGGRALAPVGRWQGRLAFSTAGLAAILGLRALRRRSLAPLWDFRSIAAVDSSDLFDRDWYISRYPDVAALGIDPVRHYVAFGAKEGRDPGPGFSTRRYLAHNPDVARRGVNPLAHFVRHGARENRGWFGKQADIPEASPASLPRTETQAIHALLSPASTFSSGPFVDFYAGSDNLARARKILAASPRPSQEFRPGLSVIVLNLERPDLIIPLVDDLGHARDMLSKEAGFEVIVGDTGSRSPDVLAFYEDRPDYLQVVRGLTYQFSRSNNQCFFERAGYDKVLFLNNDIILHDNPGCIRDMVDVFERDPGVGVVGLSLFFPDGSLQHGGIDFYPSGDLKGFCYHPGLREHFYVRDRQRAVPAVTGACLMTRSDLFSQLGGFDEDYESEAQDIDLCLKIGRLGYGNVILYCGNIVHIENATRPRGDENWTDRRRFMRRWSSYIESFLV